MTDLLFRRVSQAELFIGTSLSRMLQPFSLASRMFPTTATILAASLSSRRKRSRQIWLRFRSRQSFAFTCSLKLMQMCCSFQNLVYASRLVLQTEIDCIMEPAIEVARPVALLKTSVNSRSHDVRVLIFVSSPTHNRVMSTDTNGTMPSLVHTNGTTGSTSPISPVTSNGAFVPIASDYSGDGPSGRRVSFVMGAKRQREAHDEEFMYAFPLPAQFSELTC